jgi:epsilon-lactone hydrolase
MTITHFPSSEQGRQGIATIRTMLAQRDEGPHMPVAERRARLKEFAANAPPVDDVEIREACLNGLRSLTIVPPGAVGDVMFLHGGAYVLGSADTHKGLAARYALASGAVFNVVDYRLAPEHPYPAALDDIMAAWSALDHSKPVALVGDSAGGGLALATAIACRDQRLPMPLALAMISPWLDLSLSGPSLLSNAESDLMLTQAGLAADADRYRGGYAAIDPRISPLFADLTGLPPILVQAGTDEVLLNDAETMHRRATEVGVDCILQLWRDMTHAWTAFGPHVPEAAIAIAEAGAFLRRQFA